jgi:hypothetical protein
VGAAATVSLLLLLPPVGTPRISLREDLVALGVFAVVVGLVSALVAVRVDAMSRVEEHHAALLRAVSHDLCPRPGRS